MKISNIIVSNENLNNLTATVSFDISETTKKVDVLIKINGGEFRRVLTNQTAENIVYNIKNDLQLGINYVNIKLAHENEEYVSETFLIKLKSNPIIEGFSCPYSDSKGKFELNFTLRGDELFVYRIDLKLDDNEYQEIMSCQVQGEKKYVATSTVGNHTCKLRLYDGYDTYETESFSFEITNQKPILSNVLVTGMLNNGSASIHYAVKDIENSELTHTLTIDGSSKKINPTKVDKFCSYDISGLSVGKHNCYISISDGIDTVISEAFEIEIFISTTNKKTILQQAKTRYDRAYRSLKDIILSVVSDGIFDYDVENAIIQKAQEYYTETYSEFNKIAQQSIDIIGSNKNEMTKRDLESQLGDVDRAISSLEDTMGTTFRDGILTDTEKDILRNNLDLVAKEKSDIDRDYETLYNNADLVDPTKTKLLNAYNEFINAHNNLVLDVDRIINKTGIIDDNDKDGLSSLFEVWRGALGNYRVASLESIDSIAKKRVDDSADVLTKRWSDLQVDLDGIKLEVGSLEERVENVVVNVDTSVQTVQIMYYLSESVTELKGGTWLDVAPTWEQGKYMWSKTVTHLTNGNKTETKPVCIAGAKGQDGINAIQYYTWVRYSSNEDGSNMTSEPNEDTVYIGIAVNKTSKTPSENKEDYSWSKFMGDDGVDGKDGKDGSTTYTWIKYADDSNGNGLSNDPTNKKYIGFAYNKLIATESTNPSDYKWSLIKGTDGIDAIQYYTWVRYSNSSDGSNMYATPKDSTLYIGIAVNKTSSTPSTNKSDYTWSKFRGSDGVKGEDGADGETTYTWIKYADNASGGGLSDNPTNKTYIGFAYNKTTATESTNASDYAWSLIKGADGKDAIQYYTWVKYSDNADGTGLYDTPNDNTLYIGIAVNKTSKTESTNKSDYSWSKFKGADGVKGENGKDGVTTYTWIKYADNANGSGLSDSPIGKTYIGLAYNKTTATESTNASDYKWSLIKGTDGVDGIDGIGVKNIVELYYLSTSKTTQTGGSWVTTCPKWVEGKYLWTRTKVEYTDGTIKYTDPLCDTSWEKTNELNTNVQTITKKVSDVEVKTDSITSTVSTMQTSVTNLGTRVTNAETKVTQLDNKITSSVTEDDVKSIIEQSPTEIKYGFNDISDYVTISTSGLTVNRGSVACDLLCTPSGHDPIIKLFGSDGNCAIDATKRYNTGWGTAIRLKWDDYNYYYISDNVATIYQYGYESFMFQTDPTYRDKSRIATPNGTLVFDGSNTYDIYDSENKRLIYDGNQVVLQRSKFVETASVGGGGSYYAKDRPGSGLCFSGGTMVGIYAGKTSSSTATAMFSLFWDTDANPVIKAVHTSKNLTFGYSGLYYDGNIVITGGNYTTYCAKSSHTHSGYASSSHTHSNYASSSHTHNYASSSHSHSGYMPTSSSTTLWSGSHSPYNTLSYNLGWSQERWKQMCAKDVYADYCSASDINFKENIKYLKSDNVSLFSSDEEEDLLKPNEETNINLGITSSDLYEFTKNELRLCEYNYTDDYSRNSETGEVIRTNFENKLGFIAQDIQNTKVGNLIVGEWEGQLSYNLNNYVSVLGGALQYEITIRDAQIESLESTISDLEERIKELENKLK